MNMNFLLVTSVQVSYRAALSKIIFCAGVLNKVTVFESQVFHQNITWKGFKGFRGLLLPSVQHFEDKEVNWNLQ